VVFTSDGACGRQSNKSKGIGKKVRRMMVNWLEGTIQALFNLNNINMFHNGTLSGDDDRSKTIHTIHPFNIDNGMHLLTLEYDVFPLNTC